MLEMLDSFCIYTIFYIHLCEISAILLFFKNIYYSNLDIRGIKVFTRLHLLSLCLKDASKFQWELCFILCCSFLFTLLFYYLHLCVGMRCCMLLLRVFLADK